MRESTRALLFVLAIGIFGALALVFAARGNDAAAAAFAANILTLCVRPPRSDGEGTAQPLPILCALVCLSACEAHPARDLEVGLRFAAPGAKAAPEYRPAAGGFRTNAVSLGLLAASPLSGEAGLWAKDSDGIPRLVDTSGREYIAGAVGRGVTAGAPSGVSLGQCWTDSTQSYKLYCKESGGNLPQRFEPTAPGSIGCGGTPAAGCFTTLSSTGATTLGDAATDVITVKGALRVENAANTFYVGLTHTATANRAVTFPDAAGQIVLDAATQTLSNKTLTNPAVSGSLTAGGNTLIGAVANKINAGMLAIASQAIGDMLYADSTSTFARLPDVATGSVLASGGVGTAPAWVTTGSLTGLYSGQWLGHASGSLTAGGTKYLMTGDSGGEANNPRSLHLSAVAMQALILSCTLQTEPGTGESVVFTVIKSTDRAASFSDTTLTCTIAGTANECTDSTNHPTTAQYDLLGVKIVNSNNGLFAASDAHCTVHMGK